MTHSTQPAGSKLGTGRRLVPAEEADFGFLMHRVTSEPADHLIVTCWTSEMWDAMPADARQAGIAQHITAYARTLNDAGYGTAVWEHQVCPRVLIVAADADTADKVAPGVRAYLTEHNGGAA